ncbi:shock factor protein [Seminavis robusta]|uniref:Shock factor protein n=1 Tax=Seminavis robusta TaxID=568900 RepID=A0A9N8DHN5_9STRA|nr:shock factor protein [Seminavis robusta]|eukprot:Sro95_g049330.1 shock factor protein (302) ;mRNA; f:79131-80117
MDRKGKIPYEMVLNKKGRARLPDKLMDYLNNEELNGVIWWNPDGTSFALNSQTAQEKFLDVHFRGTKLTSFIRSLNRWGFRRVFFHAMPRNAICFQSPQFRKGERELLKEMKLTPTAISSGGSTKPKTTHERGHATPGPVVDSYLQQSLPRSLPLQNPRAGLTPPRNLSSLQGGRSNLSFPGLLSSSTAAANELDQDLRAMLQRDNLFRQFQLQQQIRQQQQQMQKQQQELQQQTRDLHLLLPSSGAAATGLPQGLFPSTVSRGARNILFGAAPRIGQGGDPPSDIEGGEEKHFAALSHYY